MGGSILVIDNYDSFTYNLVQYLRELSAEVVVKRNDELCLRGIDSIDTVGLVVSPGPCTPQQAGISTRAIVHLAPKVPTLGVCLGHQCIGEAFGARIIRAKQVVHGKTSMIYHDGQEIYSGLPSPLRATRYHSLIVDDETLPNTLVPTAWTSDGVLMGIRHELYPVEGVQFHPESILTQHGRKLLQNFLARCGVLPAAE